MNIESIKMYADKLRRAGTTTPPPPRTGRTIRPRGFAAYWAIRQRLHYRPVYAIIIRLCVIVLCISLLPYYWFSSRQFGPVVDAFAYTWNGLFLIVCFWEVLLTILSYPLYSAWDKRLPFQVEGWDKMLSLPGFGDHHWWTDCHLSVELRDPQGSMPDVMKDALYLLRERINTVVRNYMSPGSTWHYDKAAAGGAANIRVAGMLYRFIRCELVAIARETGSTGMVRIDVSPTTRWVDVDTEASGN